MSNYRLQPIMLKRSGIEFAANYLFQTEPVYALLLSGAYNVNTVTDLEVFSSEVFPGAFRPIVTVDSLEWNPATLSLDMSFSAPVTPPTSQVITRLALLRGPANIYGALPIASYTAHTQAELEAGTVNDLVVGQKVFLSGGGEATVSAIAGTTISLTSITAPTGIPTAMYPALGTLLGVYAPANGLSLIGGTQASLLYTGSWNSP